MPGFKEEIESQGIEVTGTGVCKLVTLLSIAVHVILQPDPHQGALQDWLNMQLDPPVN